MIWALLATHWWAKLLLSNENDYKVWESVHGSLMKTIIASIILDLILAGSELFHKARLVSRGRKRHIQAQQETIPMNTLNA